MVLNVDYGNGYSIKIQLLDTPVVRKWIEVFQINNVNYGSYILPRYTGTTENKLADLKEGLQHVHNSYEERREIKENINNAIENLNKYIEGEPFPYQALDEMSIEHTQRIHRSFTTGAITTKCWNDTIAHDMLSELKKLNKEVKWRIYNEFCPTTFKIIDHEKFHFWAEKINMLIHTYEPYILLPRAAELNAQNANPELLVHEWNNRNNEGQITNSVDITPTIEDILSSFGKEAYNNYDVFIHSNIYGKSYLETYIEEDPPLSYDVTNVGGMTGEFIIMLEQTKKSNFFTNSGFSNWVEKIPIDKKLVYPIPLGKIITKNLPTNIPSSFVYDYWHMGKNKITYELG